MLKSIVMKRFFTTLLAASMMLAGTSAFAQISVGAGYLNSTNKTTNGKTSKTSLPSNGFYAGAEYLITEDTGFGISVGAYYSYTTSTAKTGFTLFGVNLGASSKVEEMYLDIPVHFNFSAALTPALKGLFFVGPDFNYCLSSTTEVAGSIGSYGGTSDKINNLASDSNRFDVMLGGGVGIDYNDKIRLTLGYDFGLLNKIDSEEITQTRNMLKVGIAFLF